MWNKITQVIKSDPYRMWLFIGGFLYAWVFGQGIPLWDDDFTSWFWKIKDQSFLKYLWEWIWPISTQPEHWGFNERPVQALVYKLGYLISGYESWSYFLYKDLVYGGLFVMVYLWVRQFTPHRWPALAAAILYGTAPGTMAAHVIHSDLAGTAELWLGLCTLWIWTSIEATPYEWRGRPGLKSPLYLSWLKRWVAIALVTYLGYKTKGDLKIIPAITVAYLLLFRRHQVAYFAVPVGLMCLLTVPWGPGIFSKLPPWFPGSSGSEIAWMYQPASVSRIWAYIISGVEYPYSFFVKLRAAPISYQDLMGPFLLLGLVFFGIYATFRFSKELSHWLPPKSREDRGIVFIAIWLVGALSVVSMLPELNFMYRVRYGIITMLPMSILFGIIAGKFWDEFAPAHVMVRALSKPRIRLMFFSSCIMLFLVQAAVNVWRSAHYRREMGVVMVSVDQVYEEIATKYPNEQVVLFPNFRPYDYRPGVAPALEKKIWLTADDEVFKYAPGTTYVISWHSSLSDQFESLSLNTGCRTHTLFDQIMPCEPSVGARLMRYIGKDPVLAQAAQMNQEGNYESARALYERHLAEHPGNLGALFYVGLVYYALKDHAAMERAYGVVEPYVPENLAVIYNRALALSEIGHYDEAIERYQLILSKEPTNYGALYNLYNVAKRKGDSSLVRKTVLFMKESFPNDSGIQSLPVLE